MNFRAGLPRPRPVEAGFSLWLDFFRWSAAFAVCSSHLRSLVVMDYAARWGWLARPIYFVTGFGHEAVTIFFVLSGYLVGGEVLRHLQRGSFAAGSYTLRRMTRLYTVYPAALLLGALWDNLGLHWFGENSAYVTSDPRSPMFFYSISERLDLATFAGNLVFCQGLVVPTFGSNSALWSLANEAWYYALFPLLAWPLCAQGSASRKLACLVLFALAAWFVRGDLLWYFSLWLLGLVPHFLSRPLLRPNWLAPAALVLVLGLFRFNGFESLPRFPRHLLLAASFMLTLNALEWWNLAVPGPARLHRVLADFSYTLYLVHWPFALLLAVMADHWFKFGFRMNFSPGGVLFFAGLLAVTYVYSWGIAALTERHTAGLRRRFSPAPPVA